MRIAIEASTWVNPRGYGRFTRELTRALLCAGSEHQFTLVVDSGAARAPDLPLAPVKIVPTRQAVVDAATVESARSVPDVLRMAAALRGFDAVIFPTNYSFVPVLPGPFVVVVVHDAMPEAMPSLLQSRRARLLWGLKTRLACGRADLLATVSQASATEIRRRLPVGRREIVVLTEGASSVFSPHAQPGDEAAVARMLGDLSPFILFVGGLSPHKRVDALVQAFGVLAREPWGRSLRLVLAGPGEEHGFAADTSGVGGAIAALGDVGRRVIKTGFVTDISLAALYRRAACVVLPSVMEGFGLPAIEAMASGTPFVAARTPALEEVCGDAAELFDRLDELPDVIRRVLHDPGRRAALRVAGLQRARLFGWDEAARRLLASFEDARWGRGALRPNQARPPMRSA